jgi:bleomycin hydrolase
MKKLLLMLILLIQVCCMLAQKNEDSTIWPLTNHPESSIRFEYASNTKDIMKTQVWLQKGGTCWNFSGLETIQQDISNFTKKEVILSKTWVIYYTYLEKAFNYGERDGHTQFSMGGEFSDIQHIMKKYGLVPESAAPWGTGPDIDRLNDKLTTFLKYVVAYHDWYDRYPENWQTEYIVILEKYLGKMPKTVDVDRKMLTPKEFTTILGVNPDDYFNFICDSRLPSDQYVVFPFADNWLNASAYNLTYADFSQLPMLITQQKGGHFEWATDIDKLHFNFDMGIAAVPSNDLSLLSKIDQTKVFQKPIEESKVTEITRQKGIDSHSTTDDHGMAVLGLTYDNNKSPYFLFKNSWGADRNQCGGYGFASLSYINQYSTMISVHKRFLPNSMLKKLVK